MVSTKLEPSYLPQHIENCQFCKKIGNTVFVINAENKLKDLDVVQVSAYAADDKALIHL